MRFTMACVLYWMLQATPASAAWPEGTLGQLMEQCHAFIDLAGRNGHAKDNEQVLDAKICRAYLEGYLTGLFKERFRPGSSWGWQRVCMPGKSEKEFSWVEVITHITKGIEKLSDSWGEPVDAYPWVIVTLEMTCLDATRQLPP
jgi:hypothetical protein